MYPLISKVQLWASGSFWDKMTDREDGFYEV